MLAGSLVSANGGRILMLALPPEKDESIPGIIVFQGQLEPHNLVKAFSANPLPAAAEP